jgi:hypothetical protein
MLDFDISHNRTYWYFNKTPLYPFGYGLSYTTFSMNILSASPSTITPGDTARVAVAVTNTGSTTGDAVVQLYIRNGDPAAPRKRLKGFKRVSLSPGEQTIITFPLPFGAFASWDIGRQAFATENGSWNIDIGASSSDSAATVMVTTSGGIDKSAAPVLGRMSVGAAQRSAYSLALTETAAWQATIIRSDGKVVRSLSGYGPSVIDFHPPARGLYFLSVKGTYHAPRILKIVVDR